MNIAPTDPLDAYVTELVQIGGMLTQLVTGMTEFQESGARRRMPRPSPTC